VATDDHRTLFRRIVNLAAAAHRARASPLTPMSPLTGK
jgi:hypothetical protein